MESLAKYDSRESLNGKLTYHKVEGGTKRGKDMLVDSDGFTYNICKVTENATYWQCTVRPKENSCKAKVTEEKDGTFQPGDDPHNHMAKGKTKALKNEIKPSSAKVNEKMSTDHATPPGRKRRKISRCQGELESSSEDRSDSGFETCTIPRDDLPEHTNPLTLPPLFKSLRVSGGEIQRSCDQASTETFTAEGSQSAQQSSPVTVGDSNNEIYKELISFILNEMKSGSVSLADMEFLPQHWGDFESIEQLQHVDINPKESPLQGGGPCIFTFKPELLSNVDVKASFGNSEPITLEKTSLGYICNIPASPEMTPEVITVSFISSKPPSTILAGTSIEYYREEKYNILQAIQRITSDPNFQEILLALYKKNNLGGKPEACSSGRREDGGNDDEASGGGASGGRASGGRSSGGGSSGERAGGSGASGDGTGGTGAGGTYEGSDVVSKLCGLIQKCSVGIQRQEPSATQNKACTEAEEHLEDDQLSLTHERDENYCADSEDYSSDSSETDSASSDSDESLSAISEGEGLARWFDLCENEDAGKNEHKTDGGVEQDVFNTSVQDHGPEVENELSQEDTPLIVAVRNSHHRIASLLIDKGADVNKEVGEDTPLIVAVRNSHHPIASLLIEKGADVNKEVGEDTPLIVAVRNSHYNIARFLIEKGADVNKEVGEDTPLIVAVRNSRYHISRLLIENGADVNKEVGEDTLFTVAVWNSNCDIARLLIEKGADVKKEEIDTLFTEAIKNGDTGIVGLLVENGADVNAGSEEDTPLIVAVRNSHHRIASLLIDKGADVNKEVGVR